LDIRASRKIDRVTAGVQVRGTALEPTLSVWSDPVKEQSDALGYLILGRPLRGASQAETAQVGAAAGALQTAGGNLIAQSVGQRVGLELGVETLSDVGGTAFTAGKFLSPALYVGYGRSLVNAQTLLIVRYRFREKYEFEALSGREQKIGVNFRTER
jgi:translocation and assembly module TamB